MGDPETEKKEEVGQPGGAPGHGAPQPEVEPPKEAEADAPKPPDDDKAA